MSNVHPPKKKKKSNDRVYPIVQRRHPLNSMQKKKDAVAKGDPREQSSSFGRPKRYLPLLVFSRTSLIFFSICFKVT